LIVREHNATISVSSNERRCARDMSTIGERIREKRVESGMTMDELAERMGYKSRTSIYKIEHNITDLPLSKVSEFAKILNTTSNYLMGWKEKEEKIKNLTTSVHPIPILGEICCGDGIFTEENFDGYFYIDRSVSADYCLKARGDSMTDAGINAGDLVMIRKTPDFEQGKIYAVHRNGEQLASLKKVYKNDDRHLMLVACNPAYPPEQVDAQEVSIIGRCIGVYKNI
jgi:repressor LexA